MKYLTLLLNKEFNFFNGNYRGFHEKECLGYLRNKTVKGISSSAFYEKFMDINFPRQIRETRTDFLLNFTIRVFETLMAYNHKDKELRTSQKHTKNGKDKKQKVVSYPLHNVQD